MTTDNAGASAIAKFEVDDKFEVRQARGAGRMAAEHEAAYLRTSGHFMSDYHTVRPCPYLFLVFSPLFNGRYVLLEVDVTPSLQKGRAKFEGPHGGSGRGPAPSRRVYGRCFRWPGCEANRSSPAV